MSDPKDVVRLWFESLNSEAWSPNLDDFFETAADAAEFRALHGAFRQAFPDYHFTIDHMVAEGDKVAVFGTVSGSHTNYYPIAEFKSVEPSGKFVQWQEAQLFVVRNGKMADGWLIVDGVYRLQQLGVLPSV